jgi:DNA-binding NtrC family response regulator
MAERMAMLRILRKSNYEVSGAMSNEEARAQLKSGSFGLVITDLHMFAEDGIELVRHVAEVHPETYSLVVSGFVSPSDADRLGRAGAFDQMSKPIEPASLLEMVAKAFKHREGTMAERRHRSL